MTALSTRLQSKWVALAAIAISSALALPGNVLPILAGLLADSYRLNEQLIGYLVSANTAVALTVSVTAPWWIARVALRWLVPLSMVVVAAAVLALAIAPNYAALLLLELAIGAGSGIVASTCYTVLAQQADPARAWGVKVMLDVVLAWAFVKVVPSTHGMLLFTACLASAITAIGLLGLLLPARAVTHAPRGANSDAAASSLRSAGVGAWLSLAVLMVFSIGALGVWAFVQRLELRAGVTLANSSDVFALGLILGIGGAMAAALLGNRLGRVVPPTIAGALLVLSVRLMATTQSPAVFSAAFIAMNMSWNFFLPYMMGLLAVRDTTSRLSSLVNAALTVGSIVGPTLAGTLIHVSGYPLAMAVQCSLIAVAVAMYCVVAMGVGQPARVNAAHGNRSE